MAYAVAQLYAFINEVTKGIVGLEKIAVADTASFVSLGQAVLATDTDVNAFYSSLAARIGRTAFISRALEMDDDIERDPLDFGAALQKISISKIARTVNNDSWKTTGGNLTYTQDGTQIFATVYTNKGTFEIETKVVYDYQLKDAFTMEMNMMALVDLIFMDMFNGMELAKMGLVDTTVCTAAALACSAETSKKTCINLLTSYNEMFPTATLTAEKALYNAEFLKFAGSEIRKYCKKLRKPSTLYNTLGHEKWTPETDLSLRMLADFVDKTETYLSASTYHKELVSLPGYKEVDYWQGKGNTDDFAQVSMINVENGTISECINGVIAMAHDREAMAITTDFVRTKSFYIPKAEHTEYYHKADYGAYVSPCENCIVFYIDDYYKIPLMAEQPTDWATGYYTKDLTDGTYDDAVTFTAATQYYKKNN